MNRHNNYWKKTIIKRQSSFQIINLHDSFLFQNLYTLCSTDFPHPTLNRYTKIIYIYIYNTSLRQNDDPVELSACTFVARGVKNGLK